MNYSTVFIPCSFLLRVHPTFSDVFKTPALSSLTFILLSFPKIYSLANNSIHALSLSVVRYFLQESLEEIQSKIEKDRREMMAHCIIVEREEEREKICKL